MEVATFDDGGRPPRRCLDLAPFAEIALVDQPVDIDSHRGRGKAEAPGELDARGCVQPPNLSDQGRLGVCSCLLFAGSGFVHGFRGKVCWQVATDTTAAAWGSELDWVGLGWWILFAFRDC